MSGTDSYEKPTEPVNCNNCDNQGELAWQDVMEMIQRIAITNVC